MHRLSGYLPNEAFVGCDLLPDHSGRYLTVSVLKCTRPCNYGLRAFVAMSDESDYGKRMLLNDGWARKAVAFDAGDLRYVARHLLAPWAHIEFMRYSDPCTGYGWREAQRLFREGQRSAKWAHMARSFFVSMYIASAAIETSFDSADLRERLR